MCVCTCDTVCWGGRGRVRALSHVHKYICLCAVCWEYLRLDCMRLPRLHLRKQCDYNCLCLPQMKAVHPYIGEDEDELTLEIGDIIDVIPYEDPEEQVSMGSPHSVLHHT